MKDAGFTMEGNHLVEMSKREYSQLVSLREAVEGKAGLPSWSEEQRTGIASFDFSSVFQVIKVYRIKQMLINEFQELLDTMKDSLSQGA